MPARAAAETARCPPCASSRYANAPCRSPATRTRRFPPAASPPARLPSSPMSSAAGVQFTGYGFASIGRFAQGGLIRERFAPRLLAATGAELADAAGTNLDPFRAWQVM